MKNHLSLSKGFSIIESLAMLAALAGLFWVSFTLLRKYQQSPDPSPMEQIQSPASAEDKK